MNFRNKQGVPEEPGRQAPSQREEDHGQGTVIFWSGSWAKRGTEQRGREESGANLGLAREHPERHTLERDSETEDLVLLELAILASQCGSPQRGRLRDATL